jgi:hypothetical protein
MIIDINPSTFRNNRGLRYLDISRNQITVIHPTMFIHNKELKYVYLQGNNITEINKTLFRGLEQLEELNLSNNKIGELNPLVFHNTFTNRKRYIQFHSTYRHFEKVSKLKRINLAQNMIRSFKFEFYISISNNYYISTQTFQLDYLNISANRLTMLDVASLNWLNQTTVTDLTANPWNCDCYMLLEVWRGLKPPEREAHHTSPSLPQFHNNALYPILIHLPSRPVHASLNSSLFHYCISHATVCTCSDIRDDEMQPVYTDNFLVPLALTATSHFKVEKIFLSKCSVRLQFTRDITLVNKMLAHERFIVFLT